MRVLSFLAVLGFFALGCSAHVQASSKPWVWGWWPSHWQGLDFQPYLGGQKLSHRSLWDGDDWTPEAWIKDAGDAKRIMRDLYAAEIVTNQYEDSDNIPVLEVGDGFLLLSGLDKRRVLQFVDHVFQITESEENGMFYVYYSMNDDEPAGIYNKYGFQSY